MTFRSLESLRRYLLSLSNLSSLSRSLSSLKHPSPISWGGKRVSYVATLISLEDPDPLLLCCGVSSVRSGPQNLYRYTTQSCIPIEEIDLITFTCGIARHDRSLIT